MSQEGAIDILGTFPQIPTNFVADIGFAIPILNTLNIFGTTQVAGTTPVHTTGSGNTITTIVQLSQAQAASSATFAGLASFDSTNFGVDANGFVTFIGGGSVIESFNVDASTPPGTDPVVPTGAGVVTVTGGQVAASAVGTNVIRTNSLAANTYTIEIQRSQAIGISTIADNGVCHFDSASFDVDANGFVQLNGGGIAASAFDVQANTAPGTDPVLPTAAGVVTVNGAVVANHSVVLESRSRAANAYNLEVQYATSSAATDGTKSGVAHFDSANFTVDASGFVQLAAGFTWNDISGAFSPLKNNGYFITGTATGTLPAVPAQGDTIKFFVDHATQVLTIDAPGTQIIRLGSLVSSAGGTAVSTLQGDSVELVYRASDTCWCAVCGFSGTWIMA